MNFYVKFVEDYLTSVKWANKEEEEEKFWQVEGIIKKHSNQLFKFDISFLKFYPNNKIGKKITDKSKSDKILIEEYKNWVLIDTKEVIEYVVKNQLKEIYLDDLKEKLDWNIILPKK